ncbi:MAG: hypothetical protein P9X24_11420 [Candidatus Hatepunaea meridiana]|nr:hypothetical protein [Candidatus Hatepunaea meridiana]
MVFDADLENGFNEIMLQFNSGMIGAFNCEHQSLPLVDGFPYYTGLTRSDDGHRAPTPMIAYSMDSRRYFVVTACNYDDGETSYGRLYAHPFRTDVDYCPMTEWPQYRHDGANTARANQSWSG